MYSPENWVYINFDEQNDNKNHESELSTSTATNVEESMIHDVLRELESINNSAQNDTSQTSNTDESKAGSTKPKTKITRSRNGCVSCKKMKIKCDEAKPTCEYCRHIKRKCVYPEKAPKIKKSTCSFQNKHLQKLNSVTMQLHISSFELSLIKTYNDFGPEFFNFKIHHDAYDFWMIDIPHVWRTSPLVKNALYAITTLNILSYYDLESIENISVPNENRSSSADNVLSHQKRVNVLNEANRYFKETNNLIDNYTEVLNSCKDEAIIPELVGQILVGKTVLLSCLSLFPCLSKKSKESKQISTCGLLTVMDFIDSLVKFSVAHVSRILKTKYQKMLSLEEQVVGEKCPNEFPFIDYLRDYVTKNSDSLDPLHIPYLHTLSRMESDCYKALYFDFPVPLAQPLAELAMDRDFVNSLKSHNPISMKIMFYFCSICSILDLKMFKESSIWDEFIECYKRILNHEFENDQDKNTYNCVVARRANLIPHDFKILKSLGEPVDHIAEVPSESGPLTWTDLLS